MLAEAARLLGLEATPQRIEEWLAQLHAPTGLDIGAETPAAIALSIVAEILASNQGLGYVIASSAATFNTAGVFAGLITLAVVAWAFSALMRYAEAHLLRWKPSLTSA